MRNRSKYTEDERARFESGLPDYHDPTGGFGGAAPTYSPLSLRLTLAILSLVLCVAVAVFGLIIEFPWVYWPMIAVIGLVLTDIGVVVRRKRRGEPG